MRCQTECGVFQSPPVNRVSLLPLLCCAPGLILKYGTGTISISAKIQVHKCQATRETNHLLKLNFTLEYQESDLKRFVCLIRLILSCLFFHLIGSHFQALNRVSIFI